MKYESKRTAGKGHTVYQFSLGKEELYCIKQILGDARQKTPKTIDTMAFHCRLKNIIDEITELFTAEGIKIPRSYEHQL